MNAKHHRTLQTIFARLDRADIVWREIESLLVALGAELSEGNGSRVSMRRFLQEAGIEP